METDQQIKEDYNIWKNNTQFLYDLVMTHSLEWPSLTVEWCPFKEDHNDEGYSVQHVYLATHTADNYPNSILKASVCLPSKGADKIKDISDYDSDKMTTKGISGKLTIEQKIPHDGDVNKLRYMPQNPAVVASKSASGVVNIFNTSLFPSIPTSTEVIKTMTLSGHDNEGYGLEWSKLEKGLLASGSDDTRICCWRVDDGVKQSSGIPPVISYNERNCIIEDVAWHVTNSSLLAAAGDDGNIGFYDIRAPERVSLVQAHPKECNVISFNPFQDTLFASASSDTTVALWDARNTSHALHFLEGHMDAVFSGVWSPHHPSILATSGMDRRVIVWDLNRIGAEQTADEAEDGPAELLFIHGGHTSKVNDISWNPNEEWMMASVADDNIIQVWEMASTIYDKKNEECTLDEELLD